MPAVNKLNVQWQLHKAAGETRSAAAKFDKGAAAAAHEGATTLAALVKNLTNLTAAKT